MGWSRLILFICLASVVAPLSIRVMTWNVGDNARMNYKIDKQALRKILGVEPSGVSAKALYDIYAITLQENCWKCNKANWKSFSELVVAELKDNLYAQPYEYVGHSLTRNHYLCETWACNIGQHGTTFMYVFARRGLLQMVSEFHTNKCNGGWVKNAEKGIAGVKVRKRGEDETLCFAGLHLDSTSSDLRRDCYKRFLNEHGNVWKSCTTIFLAGDFNTRTGPKGGDSRAKILDDNEMAELREIDEMNGQKPYEERSLLKYISETTERVFNDSGPITFYPTYSLRPPKQCGGDSPCYRGDRPPSWTDRILCSPCRTFQYAALNSIYKSDHAPVFGVYLA